MDSADVHTRVQTRVGSPVALRAVALAPCAGLLGCSFVSFTREWERALRDPVTLLERDRRWREDAPGAHAAAFTDADCNALLERFVGEHSEFVGILVTGKRGTNACQSTPTADSLQTDEGWWQRTWHGQKVWHDDLRFDESANAFGVAIHVPLRRPAEGDAPPDPIGVVKALMREPS